MRTAVTHTDTSRNAYRIGIAAVAGSSAINSVGGLFVRSVEAATEWQIIMLRASSLCVALLVVFAIQRRGRVLSGFWEAGRWAVLGALFVAIANVGIVHALQNTTVANTMFVLSAAPLVTAVLARVFLRERVSRGTWIAMSVALLGIAVMMGDGVAAGSLFGNGMALLTMCAFASFMVVLRRGRAANMLPATIMGAFTSATFSACMSGFDFDVGIRDVTICVAWGAGLSCLVHVFFTFGSRFVPGAEMALLVLLEFVLSPLWVWLAFHEQPSSMTIVGGMIVICAVAGRAFVGVRQARRSMQVPPADVDSR